MREFDISPRRAFGQNFVVDPNTVRRMARLSGVGLGDHVIEIGAGLGSLTLALAETGATVRAVEVDHNLLPTLQRVVAEARAGAGSATVEIIEGDARTLDWCTTLSGADRWIMVANLPYNLATPLVLDLLRDADSIKSMVVMVQREAGERLAAPAGRPGRGIPSVVVESYGSARVMAAVPATVFYPRPKVSSVIVRIDRGDSRLAVDQRDRLERLVRAGFGKRRKMLRKSLSGFVDQDGFDRARIDPTARPEVLTFDQWRCLAAESS